MTANPLKVLHGSLMSEAVALMAQRKISELPVVDGDGRPVGLIDVTDVVGLLPQKAAGTVAGRQRPTRASWANRERAGACRKLLRPTASRHASWTSFLRAAVSSEATSATYRLCTPMNLEERCRSIDLILSDVDGVLTDGRIVFDNQGIEIKAFHVRDGLGIKLWQKAGYPLRPDHPAQLAHPEDPGGRAGHRDHPPGHARQAHGAEADPGRVGLTPRPRLLPGRRPARPAGDPRGGAGGGRGRRLRRTPPGGPLHDRRAAAAERSAR